MLLCLFLVPIRSGCDPSFCRSILEIGGPSSGCHFADAHHFFNVLSAFVLYTLRGFTVTFLCGKKAIDAKFGFTQALVLITCCEQFVCLMIPWVERCSIPVCCGAC